MRFSPRSDLKVKIWAFCACRSKGGTGPPQGGENAEFNEKSKNYWKMKSSKLIQKCINVPKLDQKAMYVPFSVRKSRSKWHMQDRLGDLRSISWGSCAATWIFDNVPKLRLFVIKIRKILKFQDWIVLSENVLGRRRNSVNRFQNQIWGRTRSKVSPIHAILAEIGFEGQNLDNFAIFLSRIDKAHQLSLFSINLQVLVFFGVEKSFIQKSFRVAAARHPLDFPLDLRSIARSGRWKPWKRCGFMINCRFSGDSAKIS